MYPVPVLYKLAPGELGCESKMKFHQRNKKDVAVRTRSKAFTGGRHAARLSHSTSRITLHRFVRSSACTTSFLSSSISKRSTVRIASLGPGSINSFRMPLASSMARMRISMSWSVLFMGFVPIQVFGGTRSPHWSLSLPASPKPRKRSPHLRVSG